MIFMLKHTRGTRLSINYRKIKQQYKIRNLGGGNERVERKLEKYKR